MNVTAAEMLVRTIDEVLDEWAAEKKNCAELEAALAAAKVEYLNVEG